jgi:hypothetical protein
MTRPRSAWSKSERNYGACSRKARGQISVLDVSTANDIIKNLVTADLLRKVFAYKVARNDISPTLLVIEEAHSFVSREKEAVAVRGVREFPVDLQPFLQGR